MPGTGAVATLGCRHSPDINLAHLQSRTGNLDRVTLSQSNQAHVEKDVRYPLSP